jgi:hypothetical protein
LHRYLRRDLSAHSLILSNLVTIVLAVVQRWDISVLMWIYWCQSVIIGLSNFTRILTLREFSTKGFRINKKPVEPTKQTQLTTAFFFLTHYGFFHLVYFVFLLTGSQLDVQDIAPMTLCVAIFLLNHTFSFMFNLKRDSARKPNIGRVMFFPYARIIPLHLTIIFGSILGKGMGKMILFLLLKTLADLIMHGVEHAQELHHYSSASPVT